MTKPTKWPMCPAKTPISLGIHPVWSESSLSGWRKLGSLATHWAHSEGSVQTGWVPRLIWVFAGHTGHFVKFCHTVAHIIVSLQWIAKTLIKRRQCAGWSVSLLFAYGIQQVFIMTWLFSGFLGNVYTSYSHHLIAVILMDQQLCTRRNSSSVYTWLCRFLDRGKRMTKPTKWPVSLQRLRPAWASV